MDLRTLSATLKLAGLSPAKEKGGVKVVKFPKLKLTITKSQGYCYHNYKVGDEFIFEDFTHPPQHFCAGILHSVFPCLYALTFGAKFPFRENQKSIETWCPDGGKMTFQVEVLNGEGKVIISKPEELACKPAPKKMAIEVEASKGNCPYGYKVGDKFEVVGLKTPLQFCGAAYHLLFPVLFAFNFGASFPFEEDPNCKTGITCPDGGKVKFKVKRLQ
jgi:uncharacterized repeat protein (TIGR04076 family)